MMIPNKKPTGPSLVIKPFKLQPKVPDNFLNETKEKLLKSLSAVFAKTSIDISKEELYRGVEDLCSNKLGASLYNELYNVCNIHISNSVNSLTTYTNNTDNDTFSSLVDSLWLDHCEQLNTVRNIFLYLDRSYALQTTGVRSIWEMGLDIFRRALESKRDVETKIIVGLLADVEADRLGLGVDKEKLRRIIRMLSSLGLYQRFELPFLEDSNRFFESEGQQLAAQHDPAIFLQHVEKRLNEAGDMIQRYLQLITKPSLISSIEKYLLSPHCSQLVERGFEGLVEGDRVTDLKRMYSLFQRISNTPMIKVAWSEHIKRVGEALSKDTDPNREKNMVEDFLKFQDRIDVILKQAFGNDDAFRFSMKSAFEHAINARPNKPAELLARYVDRKMRGEKGLDDAAVENILEKVLSLFRHLNGKDVFEGFYKHMLTKRLLLAKSASAELEKSMISKLKTECGSNFTTKLEGMFQDVDLSRDIMSAYTNYRREHPLSSSRSNIDSHFQVLTTGYWPSYPSTNELIIPTELQHIKEHFNTFYTAKYQGRRLAWAHHVERCLIVANFPKGKKDLEVSFIQALVLLCFNRAASIGFLEIKAATGVEDGELRRTLQSLACGKIETRVLTKHPKGKDVDDADVFMFNTDFSNKLYRIKINSIQLKETIEETERTHEEIFRDRQYQVDAAIVRIMKARKKIPHNSLIAELMSQLRFQARLPDIKKRIESLIERDYLARDQHDNTMYNYVA